VLAAAWRLDTAHERGALFFGGRRRLLTVTGSVTGTIYPGTTISGTGVATGTQIVSQVSGTAGAAGTYLVSIPEQTVSATTISGTYGTLTVGGTVTFTNSFNVNVEDLLKKNFPNLTVKVAPQYGAQTASNPQGIVAGNLVQLIAKEVQGQRTGFCAYNEKLRSHRLIPDTSSFKQKMTSGVWGAVIRYAAGVAQMVGV